MRGLAGAVDQTLVVINDAVTRAEAVGTAYEATLDASARRKGAHYTSGDVALGLVARALDRWGGDGVPRILDPSCGAGVFLVAAAELLVRRGVDAHTALGSLHGVDVDPLAIDAARRALAEWAGGDA